MFDGLTYPQEVSSPRSCTEVSVLLCPSLESNYVPKGKPLKADYDFKGLLVAAARFELTTFRYEPDER